MPDTPPPTRGWHPDPTGRFEKRVWNGERWTDQVFGGGITTVDPYVEPVPVDPQPRGHRLPESDRPPRPGPLLGVADLVLRQAIEFGETSYDLLDTRGAPRGTVRQVGQSGLMRALRIWFDDLTYHGRYVLEFRDAYDRLLLVAVRPARLARSDLHVAGPDGTVIGRIERSAANVWAYRIMAGDECVGEILGTSVGARHYVVTDAAGREIGTIRKRLRVLDLLDTVSDTFVLSVETDPPEPLRSLLLAAPVAVDLATFQWSWDLDLDV